MFLKPGRGLLFKYNIAGCRATALMKMNFSAGIFQEFYLNFKQGRSEGTSSVTFEVLIINCEIDFINLFIFNCLTSNINLFNFNCLASNFCFLKNIFRNRRKRLFMEARPYVGILNSFGKMMTCYLRDTPIILESLTFLESLINIWGTAPWPQVY